MQWKHQNNFGESEVYLTLICRNNFNYLKASSETVICRGNGKRIPY